MEIYAYAAGIIDGEGAISIVERHNNGRTGFVLTIQVSMKLPAKVPKWLHDNFGGNYGEYKAGGRAWGSGYLAKWAIFGFEAQDFLVYIKPYLIEKLEVAELALEFPVRTKGSYISGETREAREAICDLIRQLNVKSNIKRRVK